MKTDLAIGVILIAVGSYLAGRYMPYEAKAYPIGEIQMRLWAPLYREYDKMRRPAGNWDERDLGIAFSQFMEAIEQHYRPEIVQQHGVQVWWEIKRATDQHYQRWEEY